MAQIVHELWWEDWKVFKLFRSPDDGSSGNPFFQNWMQSFNPLLLEEILKHKWLASESAKRDLGNQAIADWFDRYWWKFCRGRRLEHVEGKRCWREFRDSDFALLRAMLRIADEAGLRDLRDQLEQVLDRMKGRKTPIHDNFEIMMWALGEAGINLQRVHEFLLLIVIDSARLPIPDEWNYVFAA